MHKDRDIPDGLWLEVIGVINTQRFDDEHATAQVLSYSRFLLENLGRVHDERRHRANRNIALEGGGKKLIKNIETLFADRLGSCEVFEELD